MKKLILKLATFLYSLTYERISLDKVNSKLIRPVEGLVIDGVQYYEFVNVADMPQERFVHYLHLRQELTMGMDRETINKYIDELIKSNDQDEKSRIGAFLYMMKDTVNNCTPLETMFNMAALVYFDKSEDLKCYDQDYNTQKIQAFKKLKDQGFFFERLLRRGLKTTGEQSPEDIAKYLNQSAVKLRAYRQMLFEDSESKT